MSFPFTIHMAQGQTFKQFTVCLKSPVFDHDLRYVRFPPKVSLITMLL